MRGADYKARDLHNIWYAEVDGSRGLVLCVERSTSQGKNLHNINHMYLSQQKVRFVCDTPRRVPNRREA